MGVWLRHALGPFLIHFSLSPSLRAFLYVAITPSLLSSTNHSEIKSLRPTYNSYLPKKQSPFHLLAQGHTIYATYHLHDYFFGLISPKKIMHMENWGCKIGYIKIHERPKAPGCFFLLGYSCWNLESGCGILFLPSLF